MLENYLFFLFCSVHFGNYKVTQIGFKNNKIWHLCVLFMMHKVTPLGKSQNFFQLLQSIDSLNKKLILKYENIWQWDDLGPDQTPGSESGVSMKSHNL